MKAHTLSILVENKAGVLSRVTGLFSRRGFNIESLAVGPCEEPDMSRITIVVIGDDGQVEQVMKQLNKLIDVIKVSDLTDNERVERELVMFKVTADQGIDPCRDHADRNHLPRPDRGRGRKVGDPPDGRGYRQDQRDGETAPPVRDQGADPDRKDRDHARHKDGDEQQVIFFFWFAKKKTPHGFSYRVFRMAAVVSEMMRIMIFFAAKTPLSDANGNDSLRHDHDFKFACEPYMAFPYVGIC